MKPEDINFPLYRKYKSNKSYFKVIDSRNFEELQIIGSKVIVNQIRAISFPEINFINDLIFEYAEMADEISEEIFEGIKSKVKQDGGY